MKPEHANALLELAEESRADGAWSSVTNILDHEGYVWSENEDTAWVANQLRELADEALEYAARVENIGQ